MEGMPLIQTYQRNLIVRISLLSNYTQLALTIVT